MSMPLDEAIESLSNEAAAELGLGDRDRIYVKNLLLRFSIEVFEGLVKQEREDNENVRNRPV